MLNDEKMLAQVKLLVNKYKQKTPFFYNHSIIVANKLASIITDNLLDKEALSDFFINEYKGKKSDQPITILDNIADILKQAYGLNEEHLVQNSIVSFNSEVQEIDETLGIYRVLEYYNRELQELTASKQNNL